MKCRRLDGYPRKSVSWKFQACTSEHQPYQPQWVLCCTSNYKSNQFHPLLWAQIFQCLNQRHAIHNIEILLPCSNWVTGRAKSKIFIPMARATVNWKDVYARKHVAFQDVAGFMLNIKAHVSQFMIKCNKQFLKYISQLTCSIHPVLQTSLNLTFSDSRQYF